MRDPKKKITLEVSEETNEWLEKKGQETERSKSAIVRLAIRSYREQDDDDKEVDQ